MCWESAPRNWIIVNSSVIQRAMLREYFITESVGQLILGRPVALSANARVVTHDRYYVLTDRLDTVGDFLEGLAKPCSFCSSGKGFREGYHTWAS